MAFRDSFRVRCSMTVFAAAGFLFILALATALSPSARLELGTSGSASADRGASPALGRIAAEHPRKRVEAIVQLQPGTNVATGKRLVASLGGRTTGDLHLINGLVVKINAGGAAKLADHPGVRAVSLNARVKKDSAPTVDSSQLQTSYPDSLRAPKAWGTATGKGVGVAVIDTGVAGDLPDFATSSSDSQSRVVATAVVNPDATNDGDGYGHGTHVAGIIAGNGNSRPDSDPLKGRYVGVAPEADVVSIKIADEQGNATVLDAIYGLQFAVDHKDDYNIRVANLSLESTDAQSYRTDPLDAASEAAWFNGIVVVASAGNRGTDGDAVSYAPGNDPYVISVGGVDDQGTKTTLDDSLASWSSRGSTQDGYAKPDVLAPGAHIVSLLAPDSEFSRLCPTCVVSGEYIRAGGTSQAAPMVTGTIAGLLQAHPGLSPDQVKGAVVANARKVLAGDGADEVSFAGLVSPSAKDGEANVGLEPNDLIDPATGNIDYARSSWSRSSWSRSSWSRSSWSRSSWSRSSWSRSSWSRSSWSRSSWSRSSWSTSWNK